MPTWESLTTRLLPRGLCKVNFAAPPLSGLSSGKTGLCQVWFCGCLQTDLGVMHSSLWGHREAHYSLTQSWRAKSWSEPSKSLPFIFGKIRMPTFLLARNICIYHPLLNKLISSTSQTIVILLSANIHNSYLFSLSSLNLSTVYFLWEFIFSFKTDNSIKWVKIPFPQILNGKP